MNLAIGPLPASPPPLVVEDDVAEARRAFPRAQSFSLSKKERGCAAAPGAGMARTTPPALMTFLNALNVTSSRENSSVTSAMIDRIAQIRLVGAVFQHRFAHRGCAGTCGVTGLAAAELLEHAAQHRLDRVEHVLLRDETHLDVELIEFAGRAVGAGILVAKAGRDLEVAVEAGDHDQLLELLRRLRQGVEFAGMEARRHQDSRARPSGRGGGQDRRLELEEALRRSCGGGCSR